MSLGSRLWIELKWFGWFCSSSWLVVMLTDSAARSDSLISLGTPELRGSELVIPLVAEVESTTSAVRVSLSGDWITEVSTTKTISTQEWEIFVNAYDDTLDVLLLDTTNTHALPVGWSTVLLLSIEAESIEGEGRTLRLQTAEFSTDTTPPSLIIPHIESPELRIPEHIVRIGDVQTDQGGGGELLLSIQLLTSVSALQFDLTILPRRQISFGIPESDRTRFPVFMNSLENGDLRLLVSDPFAGVPLDTGIVRLTVPFAVSRGSTIGESTVAIKNSRVVDMEVGSGTLLGASGQIRVLQRSNTIPELVSDTLRIYEGDVFSWSPSPIDLDGDPVTVNLISGPDWLLWTQGVLYGRPEESEVGESTICVALDDSFAVVTDCVSLVVLNQPPKIEMITDGVGRTGHTTRIETLIQYCDECDIDVVGLPGAYVDTAGIVLLPIEKGRYDLRIYAEDSWGAIADEDFVLQVWDRPRIRIEEVLADPPSGAAGDANQDGERSGFADEFVELFNADQRPVDISGWTLSDDDTKAERRFAFPPGTTIDPGQRLVLFGGGTSERSGDRFIDDGRIGNGLTNTGDTIVLYDPVWEDTIDAVTFATDTKAVGSFHRREDTMVPHSDFPGYKPMSPGRARIEFAGLRVEMPDTITSGQPAPIQVYAVFSDRHEVDVTEEVTWIISHETLQIDSNHLLATDSGKFAISARWNGHRRDAQVRVIRSMAPRVEFVEPDPPIATWRVGIPYCYDATADNAGHDLQITSLMIGFPVSVNSVCWTPSVSESGVIDVVGGEQSWSFPLLVLPRPSIHISEVLTHPLPLEAHSDYNLFGSDELNEFVELHNFGDTSIDLTGWTLSDDDTHGLGRFTFPSGTNVPPDGYTVLFSSAQSDSMPPLWFSDDGTIGNGLANRSERVLLVDPALRDTIDRIDLVTAATNASSVTRTGSLWLPHDEVYPGQLYSPGFAGQERRPLGQPEHIPRVRISEIHPSPAVGVLGDTNQDGTRDAFEDEFVEIENADTNTVALLGWSIDAGRSQYIVIDTVDLKPGERLVLFGGGHPNGIQGQILTASGRIGGGLANGGGVVVLRDSFGRIADDVTYPAAVAGISLVADGERFTLHSSLPGRGRLSPGSREPRLIDLDVSLRESTVEVGDTITYVGTGTFDDGIREAVTEDLTASSTCPELRLLDQVMIATGEGECSLRFTIPGYPDTDLVLTIIARRNQPLIVIEVEPLSNVPDVDSLPKHLTVLTGTPFRAAVKGDQPDVSALDWLNVETGTLEGTPSEPGVWNLALHPESGDRTITIRAISPSTLLEHADDKAYVGMTWLWEIPATHGLSVQVGEHGRFEPERNAVIWRPDEHHAGRQHIEIAVSPPGMPATILTKPVVVATSPMLSIDGLMLVPDTDANGDGQLDDRDAFVRIQNDGQQAVDLGGWSLHRPGGGPFSFADGVILEAGNTMTVHGGGQTASENTESWVRLVAPAGPDTLVNLKIPDDTVGGELVPDPHQAGNWIEAPDPAGLEPLTSYALANREVAIRTMPCPTAECADIELYIDEARYAVIEVYNTLGQAVDRIHSGFLEKGVHRLRWCPGRSGMGVGTYLIVDTQTSTRPGRVVLVK
jgi:hypothetical protein